MSSWKLFKVYPTRKFISEAKKLKKKYPEIGQDFHELSKVLKRDPVTGNDPLGKSCYKVRMSITNKASGKSAGARIIILVLVKDKEVYLLSVYDKAYKDTLSGNELDQLLKNVNI